jgi:hypothetical protein
MSELEAIPVGCPRTVTGSEWSATRRWLREDLDGCHRSVVEGGCQVQRADVKLQSLL